MLLGLPDPHPLLLDYLPNFLLLGLLQGQSHPGKCPGYPGPERGNLRKARGCWWEVSAVESKCRGGGHGPEQGEDRVPERTDREVRSDGVQTAEQRGECKGPGGGLFD